MLYPSWCRFVYLLTIYLSRDDISKDDFRIHLSGLPLPPRPNQNDHRDTPYFTRQNFETILRRSVLKTRKNIQLINGTVTGVNQGACLYENKLESVAIRSKDGKELEEEADIVVGKLFYFCQT